MSLLPLLLFNPTAAIETQKRLEKLRQERLESERKTCTFAPKVNNYSEKLLSQRASNLGGNNPQARCEKQRWVWNVF